MLPFVYWSGGILKIAYLVKLPSEKELSKILLNAVNNGNMSFNSGRDLFMVTDLQPSKHINYIPRWSAMTDINYACLTGGSMDKRMKRSL